MKRIWTILLFAMIILLPAAVALADTNVNINVNSGDNVPTTGTAIRGNINWDKGIVQVTGTGVPPAQVSSLAQANAMARRAAVVDAYRNLLEAVGEIRVEAATTIQNYEAANDVVRTRISGIIQGARVVSEQPMPDGSYQVTMQVNLFGANSVAAALEDQMRPAAILPVPAPSSGYQPPANLAATYTGVIIDARGLGLQRVMSPRIYDETGRIIYGNMYIDPDKVVQTGMVDYATAAELNNGVTAGLARSGSNAITVKAIGLKDFNANVVISKSDADMILAANAQSNFLARTAVVFLE